MATLLILRVSHSLRWRATRSVVRFGRLPWNLVDDVFVRILRHEVDDLDCVNASRDMVATGLDEPDAATIQERVAMGSGS